MLKLIVERGEGRVGRADSGELRGESGEPFDGAQGEWRGESGEQGELIAES